MQKHSAQSLRCEGAESPQCADLLARSCPPPGTEETATSPPFPGCGRRDGGYREMRGGGHTETAGPGRGHPKILHGCGSWDGDSIQDQESANIPRGMPSPSTSLAGEEEGGRRTGSNSPRPRPSCQDRTFSPTRRQQKHVREIAVFR